jgi:hypothetical protein
VLDLSHAVANPFLQFARSGLGSFLALVDQAYGKFPSPAVLDEPALPDTCHGPGHLLGQSSLALGRRTTRRQKRSPSGSSTSTSPSQT